MDVDKQTAMASVVSTLFKGTGGKTHEYAILGDTLKANLATLGYHKLAGGYYGVVFACDHDQELVMKVGTDVTGDGYLKYAMYCLLNRRPELPVIYSVHVFDNVYVVFMERLSDPVPDDDIRATHAELRVCQTATDVQEILGFFTDFHVENFMMRRDQPVITDPYSWCSSAEWYCDLQEGSFTTDILRGIEHDRKMATARTATSAGREEEDRALRKQPKHDYNEPAKRLVRVLSQMQIARIREEGLASIFSGPVRACQHGGDWRFELACGLHLSVVHGRPYIHRVLGVAIEGRDHRKLEEAVQDWVEQEIRPRRHTDLWGKGLAIGDTIPAHSFIRSRSQVRAQDEHAKQVRADIDRHYRGIPHKWFFKPHPKILHRDNRRRG